LSTGRPDRDVRRRRCGRPCRFTGFPKGIHRRLNRVIQSRRQDLPALTGQIAVFHARPKCAQWRPLAGEEAADLVKQVSATPADVIARVRAAIEKK
jgi:hypothetical protein